MFKKKSEKEVETLPTNGEGKKKKGKARKIIEWVVTGVFVALVAALVGIKLYEKNTNTSVLGTRYPIVLTDSMEPEYMVDDVLIVSDVKPEEIQKDDDITFYWDLDGKGNVYPMTHRIESVTYYENADENKGYHYTFVAHGINTHSEQCGGGDCTFQTQTFHEDVIIGKVQGKSGFLKVFYKIITSVWTLIILILIPCLYIMVTTVIDMFKKLEEQERLEEIEKIEKGQYVPPTGKKDDPLAGLSQKDRERLKKELLEEMLKKKGK